MFLHTCNKLPPYMNTFLEDIRFIIPLDNSKYISTFVTLFYHFVNISVKNYLISMLFMVITT